jgi:hypothetical protein
MSTFAKAALAAVAVIATAQSAAMADTSGARWVVRSISNGPRPAQYVLVRVATDVRADQPYALTGEQGRERAYRASIRPAPLHPRGPQSPY